MDKACYPNWWLWMINFIITGLNFLIPLLFSSIALLQCFGDCWTNLTEKMGSSLSFIASASHCPCQVSIFVCPVRTSCNICLSESTCEFLDLFPSLFHTLSLYSSSSLVHTIVLFPSSLVLNAMEGSSLWSQLGWPLFKVNGINMMNDVIEQVLFVHDFLDSI